MFEGLTMKADAKAAWLWALRSGFYTKAKLALARVHKGKVIGNCCLGVFATISNVPNKNDRLDVLNTDDGGFNCRAFFFDQKASAAESHNCELELPWFAQFFDWDENEGNQSKNKFEAVRFLQSEFIDLNDNQGWSFLQIADWAETNL